MTDSGLSDNEPSITPDLEGNIHVVWGDLRDGNGEIYYRLWDGLSWHPAFRLTNDPALSCAPSIAADPTGNVHVVWSDQRDGNTEIYYKFWDGMVWSPDLRLTNDAASSGGPAAAADADGNLHVVWEDYRDDNSEIYYKFWDGMVWSPDLRLSDQPRGSSAPAIAADPSGNIHVIWDDVQCDIYYKRWDGSSWSPSSQLTSTDPTCWISERPSIVSDARGNLHVTWDDLRDGNSEIYYKLWDGVSWSSDIRLTDDPAWSSFPVVAADPNGTAHLVWMDYRDGNSEIYYKRGRLCADGQSFEHCRAAASADILFASRYTTEADTISSPEGEPFFFDSTRITATRGVGDRFFLSGSSDSLAPWICDDAVYVDGVGTHHGPYQIIDPTLALCRPVDSILGALPAYEITNLVPMGTGCVTFKLGDIQRAILGNTEIYLIKQSDQTGVAVAYWPFDEGTGSTAADGSGNGHDGTISGAGWVPGVRGSALAFDGDDYVDINAAQVLPTNPPIFTIAAWIRTTHERGTVFVQTRRPGQSESDTNHHLMAGHFDDFPPLGGGISFAANVLDGQWHHVAVAVEGGMRQLYVDGAPDAAGPQETYTGAQPSHTRIGDRLGWMPEIYGFVGAIDEVRAYERALTPGEVRDLFLDIDCLTPSPLADCRAVSSGLLFGARWTIDASGIPSGDPYIFDQTTVTLTKELGDHFYLSGGLDSTSSWICGDEVYVNGVSGGLGFSGILDPTYPVCRPIEEVMFPAASREITDLIPDGTTCVEFRLANTQREIYGNTSLYIYKWHDPAAVNGTITGVITDAETGLAISGASIQVFQGSILVTETQSGQDGDYRIELPAGEYLVRVQIASYIQQERSDCQVLAGDETVEDFALVPVCWPYILSSVDFDGFNWTQGGTSSARLKLYSPTPQPGTLLGAQVGGWTLSPQEVEASECNNVEITLSAPTRGSRIEKIPFELSLGGTTFTASHQVVADYPLLTPTDLGRTDWGPYDDLLDLLTSFAPILVFEQGEKYYPVGIDVILENASLRDNGPDRPPYDLPDMADLKPRDLGRYSWSFLAIDLPCEPNLDPDGCLNAYLQAGGDPSTVRYVVYVTAIRQSAGNESYIALQYWMNYYFNDWETVECDSQDSDRLAHEGDWEHIGIILDMSFHAKQIVFGGHSQETLPWDGDLEVEGDHPIVYVGKGSHANYSRRGMTCAPTKWPTYEDYHYGNGLTLRPPGFAGPRTYSIEILPRWTNLTDSPSYGWLEFSGLWGTGPYRDSWYDIPTGKEVWPGPAFRGEWSDPLGVDFKNFRIWAEARSSLSPMGGEPDRRIDPVPFDLVVLDPLGREVSSSTSLVPGATYATGIVDTVGGEVLSRIEISIPLAIAGQYNVLVVSRSGIRTEVTCTLATSREWIGSPVETLVLAQDLPITEVPPGGYNTIPSIPCVGLSGIAPEYWNMDWEIGDPEPIEWRLTPSEVPFDAHDLIPESLRLNGTVAPLLPVAFEDSSLVLRFPRGEAVHSIPYAEANTYSRVVLTGQFSDSLIRLESPAMVRLLTTTGVGEVAATQGRFHVEFPQGNICRDGIALRLVLPRAGRVQVRIVDVSGRLVRALVDEEYAQGSHLLPWDGRVSTGKRVAAGIYFVQASFDGQPRSPRIIVIR